MLDEPELHQAAVRMGDAQTERAQTSLFLDVHFVTSVQPAPSTRNARSSITTTSPTLVERIGHGAASFINVITKSGTDHIHGAAFEFVRNAAFDARNYFDRGPPDDPGRIPPFERNEFGLALGGPIVPNRTFFFVQYHQP